MCLRQREARSDVGRPGPGPELVRGHEAAVEGPCTSPVVAQMNCEFTCPGIFCVSAFQSEEASDEAVTQEKGGTRGVRCNDGLCLSFTTASASIP